jgi:hypothetical protein
VFSTNVDINDVLQVGSLTGPHTPHGVAQTTIHAQIASQGTGVVNVHDVDMAMY